MPVVICFTPFFLGLLIFVLGHARDVGPNKTRKDQTKTKRNKNNSWKGQQKQSERSKQNSGKDKKKAERTKNNRKDPNKTVAHVVNLCVIVNNGIHRD